MFWIHNCTKNDHAIRTYVYTTDDIRALKIIRRKNEVICRKNPLCINFEIFQESCMAVKHAIDENKT